tara:strand:- start:147 stop:362 length:216 start_codon:yes stop_codon:yes gene_type:complete
MTYQALSGFIRAAKRSAKLRRGIRNCKDDKDLIKLASYYGFNLCLQDLEDEKISEKIESWFQISRIKPIKI